MALEKLDAHMPKKELDPCLRPYTKINPEWSKYLKLTAEPIALLEENVS